MRPALNSKIERGFLKDYYEDLDDLLGERNAWLHRQVQETKSELLDLIATLLRVGKPLNLKIVEDCMSLRDLILNPIPATVVELAIPITVVAAQEQEVKLPEVKIEIIHKEPIKIEQTDMPENIQATVKVSLLDGEKRQIGEIVNERLLSHSYVLHLNGEIKDRASEELLSTVNPNAAQELGALLIGRKPNGGRVRITEDGILCAFFGEKWGYLAQVKPEDWFPNHLSNLTEEQ